MSKKIGSLTPETRSFASNKLQTTDPDLTIEVILSSTKLGIESQIVAFQTIKEILANHLNEDNSKRILSQGFQNAVIANLGKNEKLAQELLGIVECFEYKLTNAAYLEFLGAVLSKTKGEGGPFLPEVSRHSVREGIYIRFCQAAAGELNYGFNNRMYQMAVQHKDLFEKFDVGMGAHAELANRFSAFILDAKDDNFSTANRAGQLLDIHRTKSIPILAAALRGADKQDASLARETLNSLKKQIEQALDISNKEKE